MNDRAGYKFGSFFSLLPEDILSLITLIKCLISSWKHTTIGNRLLHVREGSFI